MSGLRKRHQKSGTSLATNTRAVSNLIGFILLFSILLLALAGYQAQVVPEETAQTEFEHHQTVQNNLIEFRNAIFETATEDQSVFGSGGAATTVQLGVTHPSRTLTVGPPSSAGTLQTSDAYNVTVHNTQTNRSETVPTRFVEYAPQYSEYRVGSIWYENSMLYLDERDRGVTDPTVLADQQLVVDGRPLRVIATQNEISETGIRSTAIETYAADTVEQNPELFEAETRRMRIVVPTRLNMTEYWGDELNGSVQYSIAENASEPGVHELEVLVEPAIEINTVGFQSGPTENPVRSPNDAERERSTPNDSAPGDPEAVVDGMEGDGTDENPYVITKDTELQSIDANESTRGANYTLGTNIDASNTDKWNDNNGFEPIGLNDTEPFSGSLDGNGYAIVGLTIDRHLNDSVGLFSETNTEAHLSNISLEAVDINGEDNTGGLVGSNDGGTIKTVSVSGIVDGNHSVGGVVGENSGTLTDSYATATVRDATRVGGVVGYNEGTITQSHATGTVEGTDSVGGLVGKHEGGSSHIERSYAVGNIRGETKIGGLVGSNSGSIEIVYAQSTVDGDNTVGGLVGQNDADGHTDRTISDTFATGAVDGGDADAVGGLVGVHEDGNLTNSYWDNGTTNQGDAIGDNSGDTDTVRGFGETRDGLPAEEMIGTDTLDDGNMDELSETDWRELEHPDDYPLLGR